MNTFELTLHITGEAYPRVQQYRQEMDYRVIRNQIERRGHATVTYYQGQHQLQQITTQPAVGEAVPWYGDADTGYSYSMVPEAKGVHLKVENLVSGNSFFCSKILPPLELHLEEDVQLIRLSNQSSENVFRHAGTAFQETEGNQEICLSITSDIYPRLAAWPSYGKALYEYEFTFCPLKVGNLVRVKHIYSGETIDLTRDIDW